MFATSKIRRDSVNNDLVHSPRPGKSCQQNGADMGHMVAQGWA